MPCKPATSDKTITHCTHDADPDPNTPEAGRSVLLPAERFATAFPCHSPLEADSASFLDAAPDVLRYVKNERCGFAIPYREGSRTQCYYPDFIIEVPDPANPGLICHIIAETKAKRWSNTLRKRQIADAGAAKLAIAVALGPRAYHLIDERPFRRALTHGDAVFASLLSRLEPPP